MYTVANTPQIPTETHTDRHTTDRQTHTHIPHENEKKKNKERMIRSKGGKGEIEKEI